MFKKYILIFLCVYELGFTAVPLRSYYWSNRKLDCINHGIEVSRCSLRQSSQETELNPGCFDEIDKKNNTRIYCRLNCEESDEAIILQKLPTWNHVCNTGFNYHLERRRKDWYLWRLGDCTSTTIAFEVRCGFPKDPSIFYKQNKHLFDYEDTTNAS